MANRARGLSSIDAGSPNDYTRTHSYDDKGIFEPDRIVIPPPNVNYDGGTPAFNVPDVPDFVYVNNSCGNPSFLQSIRSFHKLQLRHHMLDWKYEHRRTAQPILPFLFLGPGSAAQNATFVHTNGITFMVAVRNAFTASRLPRFLDPTSFRSAVGLKSTTLDLDSAYDLVRNVRRVIKSMNDHLENSCVQQPITSVNDIQGKILVFCESGNERSTVLVCAYLMFVYGLDTVTAIHVVQSQRFCIDVKDEMKSMLLDLDAMLVAERQVASAKRDQGNVNSGKENDGSFFSQELNRSAKRSIDESYEDNDEMREAEDWYPIDGNGRAGVAPFAEGGN